MRIDVLIVDDEKGRKQFCTHDYKSLEEVKSKVQNHLNDHQINIRVNILEKPKKSITVIFMVRAAYSDNQKQQSLSLPVYYMKLDQVVSLIKKIV